MKLCTSRRGIAPLELVMVLPLVVGLWFAMFSIMRATLSRMDAIESARLETWKKLPKAQVTEPMVLYNPLNDGQVVDEAAKMIELNGWWGGIYVSESKNEALGGTWDYKSLPFNMGEANCLPHLNVVSAIADQFPLGNGVDDFSILTLTTFAAAMDLTENKLLQPLVFASRIAMDGVVVAGVAFDGGRVVLQVVKDGVEILEGLLGWFHRSLAKFLRRLDNLLSLGEYAFQELYNASHEEALNWPSGGLNVGGAFP